MRLLVIRNRLRGASIINTKAFSVVADIGIVEKILAAIIVGAIVATVIYIIWK